MRKLNTEQQFELLQSNLISRMRTLGNDYFYLTVPDLEKLAAAMNRYSPDVIYSSFYNWTEVQENKHARNLDSFVVKQWINRGRAQKKPIGYSENAMALPPHTSPAAEDPQVGIASAISCFQELRKTLSRHDTPIIRELFPDKQEKNREEAGNEH